LNYSNNSAEVEKWFLTTKERFNDDYMVYLAHYIGYNAHYISYRVRNI